MQTQENMTCFAWLSNLLDGNYKAAPTAHMLSASQNELRAMMHGETGKLLELRTELEKEMERISEDYVSMNTKEIDKNLYNLTVMKGYYQNDIEDFVNMYTEVMEDTSEIDKWSYEVKDIQKVVRDFNDNVRIKARAISKVRPRPKIEVSVKERAEMNRWLKDFTEKNQIGGPDYNLSSKPSQEADLTKDYHDVPSGCQLVSRKSPPLLYKAGDDVHDQHVQADLYLGSGPLLDHTHHQGVLQQDGARHHGDQALAKACAVLNAASARQDIYQDSGGVEAAWQDLHMASSKGTGDKLEQHTFYQDSGGHGASSQDIYLATEVEHDYVSQSVFYQANHAGGMYLAAKAAQHLATVSKPGTFEKVVPIAGVLGIGSNGVQFQDKVANTGYEPLALEVVHLASDSEPGANASLNHSRSGSDGKLVLYHASDDSHVHGEPGDNGQAGHAVVKDDAVQVLALSGHTVIGLELAVHVVPLPEVHGHGVQALELPGHEEPGGLAVADYDGPGLEVPGYESTLSLVRLNLLWYLLQQILSRTTA